ncbi:MAG: acyl-homoserine-lactone synthase [Sphingomonas sp.]|jgi:acyl-homoserine lactone synthase|uniref:acyl-homoserine-lactone synthase n=1 Tax=Sphingomonas sp. TaxID=28214 RepID=UPI00356847F1
MLHVVQNDAVPPPDGIFRSMFAARKSVFVDLLKWDVPVLDGRYEIDQFDDEHARYLILADRDEGHLGSARLLPTTRPHILDSLYDMLCEGPPPRGDTIFEVTRFCLDRRLCAPDRRAVRDALVAALAGHALDHGIESYTAIAEFGWYQQILAFGWRCEPLGLPCLVDGRTLAALHIFITPETPALLAAAGIRGRHAILANERLAAA